jgi:putative PIN family toxin of toxin-antitoxin system
VARLRVVVDTSSLIRATLNAASAAGQLIEYLTSQQGGSQLVASADILHELAMVLGRPKFASRLSAQQRRRFLLNVQVTAFFVSPAERIEECRDPADNIILEAALAAREPEAEDVIIVSDDRDLLTLDPWRGIRIAKPEAALVILSRARTPGRNRGRRR